MSEFRKPKKFGSDGGRPGGFGGRPSFNRGGRDGEKPAMFEAVCAKCQKTCEVPFRPNGNKPVYCKDCFRTIRDEDEGMHSFRPESAPRRDFAPAMQKPQADTRLDNLSAQVNALHQKMDKVLAALQLNKPAAAPVVVADEPEAFGFNQEAKVVETKSRKVGSAFGGKAPAKKKSAAKKK
jgi:CxxC-x17-CxxC domain-containing protein